MIELSSSVKEKMLCKFVEVSGRIKIIKVDEKFRKGTKKRF